MAIMMNKLTEDVIIYILLRLSVKSLLRFKIVCKSWSNLIKRPDFIIMQSNHPSDENDRVLIKRCLQTNDTNILSIHYNTESLNIASLDLDIPHMDKFLQVIGPCNGFVCFTNYETIVMCNPSIREFTLLPDRPFICPQDMCCNYDGVGFGFDTNTNDCKVIRLVELQDEEDYSFCVPKAELYRCSTNSWEEIDYQLPTIQYEPCFETVFLGATHWNALCEYETRIFSFNITNEVFQEFDFPKDCPFLNGRRRCLTVLNGSLAMFYYTCPMVRTDQQFIDVWEMKEYGVSESWTKLFAIGPLSEIEYPMTILKNSTILLERTNGQLISCDLENQEVKEFNIVGCPMTLRALVYKESLISLKRWSTKVFGKSGGGTKVVFSS